MGYQGYLKKGGRVARSYRRKPGPRPAPLAVVEPEPAPEPTPRSWRQCGCGREFFGRADVCTPCRVEIG